MLFYGIVILGDATT